MKGRDVMLFGSIILILLIILIPIEYLLDMAIPFIMVETFLALYIDLKKHRKGKEMMIIKASLFVILGLLIIVTDSMKIKYYSGLLLFAIGLGMFSTIIRK